jgi:hypothetical protein
MGTNPPVSTAHTLAVQSAEHDVSVVPSREKARPVTAAEWPLKCLMGRWEGSSRLKSPVESSANAAASILPSSETAMVVTGAGKGMTWRVRPSLRAHRRMVLSKE